MPPVPGSNAKRNLPSRSSAARPPTDKISSGVTPAILIFRSHFDDVTPAAFAIRAKTRRPMQRLQLCPDADVGIIAQ
jgi:hypothetical protein